MAALDPLSSPDAQVTYIDNYTPSKEPQEMQELIGRRRLRINNGQDPKKHPEKFTPLPESAVEDLLSFEESADTKGRQRPEFTIDSALVGALLWLFVLSHHGLLEGGANAQAQQSSSSSSRRGEAPAAVPRAPRSTRVGGKR